MLTLVPLVVNLVNTKRCEKSWKITETMANECTTDCTHQELSNTYQHGSV